MIRIPYRQSMDGPVPTPARTPTWEFNGECISCKDAKISTYEQAIMGSGRPVKTCANCEIEDVKLAPAEIPKPVPKKGAWKNVMDDTTCLGFVMAQPSPNATCPMNMICALNMYPPGGKGADVSDYDCHLLAKADPRCGKYMIQRAVGHENQASCMCYRGEGGNLPCCGPCVTKRIKDLILSEI
jgi:hypothetical protein